MTVLELLAEVQRLSTGLDQAIEALKVHAGEAAKLTTDHKRDWSKAYLRASGPVKERECEANVETASLAFEADVAERMERVWREVLQTKRQQLSAVQSTINAVREEMALSR